MTRTVLDLATLDWTLEGWRPSEWELAAAVETSVSRVSDVGPIPARFPGSVRGALLAADLIPDPTIGLQSRASEFIEHRHWIYRAVLPEDLVEGDLTLEFAALDGPAVVFVGGARRAETANAHLPLVVDLGAAAEHRGAQIAVVFLTPPPYLGQIGHTSETRSWRPRFNYGWDWIPRMVQIGAARTALAAIRSGVPTPTDLVIRTEFTPDAGTAPIVGRGVVRGTGAVAPGLSVIARLTSSEGDVVAEKTVTTDDAGRFSFSLDADRVAGWWGAASLHRLEVGVDGADPADRIVRPIGFRDVAWRANPGAPEGAEPWLLEIDGAPVFLRGVNWAPLRGDYADVGLDEYRRRLDLYRDLGVNILRVWGGASRERDEFYDLCDERGLLVWQELPQSSSGLDNHPPLDDAYAAELAEIAGRYARDLHHHPSLVVWSGGNELAGAPGEPTPGTPLTFDHPALRAAGAAIREIDPERKIVPTSPTGPRYTADESEFGLGLHHDVHGPWVVSPEPEGWARYWAADDALLRSEVGVAGSSGLDLLERHGLTGTDAAERAHLWRHTSNWWFDRDTVPDADLPGWVENSQREQADALRVAASAAMDRFPACGGFIVWMGHDAFPCAISLAVVDYDGRAKPAALALGDVYRRQLPTESLTATADLSA
ncbi:glycosyl hydrolase 2 galactose-binding domain-containing protein [Microbacterium sp. ZW T5_45]|uniref:glycosyl hydrolase 2 galactose-binding domain-containing protein n=1 Tax=Microbacterium sp. ZW T5_45 TaxID=3378080 RepID=UPI0038528209